MSIIIGSARIDENGNASGGALGDNTGTEVSTQSFYVHSKGWYVIRPKDADLADKLANCMQSACDNDLIGYDQSNRDAIVTDTVYSRVPTECDCSSLVRACVLCASGGTDPGDFTTYTERKVLAKTGFFEDPFTFVSLTETPIYNGDILVTKTKGHTVIVVSGNPREVAPFEYYPQYTGNSSSIVDALKAVGEKDTSLNHRKQIAFVNDYQWYAGRAYENIGLLVLLKKGKLRKR